MNDSQQAQPGAETPASPHPQPLPEGRGEETDPEIAELLKFEPVPRAFARKGAWTPALQREFIVRLARSGSPNRACEEMSKDRHGLNKVYKSPDAASFRDAWHKAIAIAERREEEEVQARLAQEAVPDAPYLDRRRRAREVPAGGPALLVICERCGAEGVAGEESFAGIPDILAFDPVPVRLGPWDDEAQRAFIAALAATGSPARAAKSIGRHLIGAEKLRKARGGRGFADAWEAALDIARERELARMGPKLDELASTEDDSAYHADGSEYSPADIEEVRERVIRKFLRLAERQRTEATQSNEEQQ